jgi:uncharacterized membrane protein YeiB
MNSTTEATQPTPAAPYTSPIPDVQSNGIGPLNPANRLALVDVLRGVAILGVLVAYTMWNLGTPPANTWTAAERVVDTTLGILVDA